MQKYKYIFVEKLGGENIYVFTYIYINYFCNNTGCFQEEEVNGRAIGDLFL